MDTVAPRKGFDVVAYLKLFRFPLVFTAIADSAAGYLLTNPFRPEPLVLSLLAVCSAGLYFFGMGMNDLADLPRDREIAPNRVLPSGRLSVRKAVFAGLAALAVSLSAILGLGFSGCPIQQRLLFWGIAVAAILSYDFHLLKVPPVMGVVRASNFLIGAGVGSAIGYDVNPYMAGNLRPWMCAFYAFPEFLYVTALTFISTLEDGPIRRARVALGAALMGLAVFLAVQWVPLTAFIGGNTPPSHWGSTYYTVLNYFKSEFRLSIPLAATSLALIGWMGFRAYRVRERKDVMLLVRDSIGGIIVLNAIVLMSVGSTTAGFALLGLILPAVVSVAIFKRLA